jgi:ABC-2 type transport system permease protein
MSTLKLFWLLRLKSFKAELQYPANFLAGLLGTSLIGGVDILLLLVPATAFKTIGGWDFWQLGFMFALWKMSHGLHEALFIPFRGKHDEFLRMGDYDSFLVRPMHPILQILARSEFVVANTLAEWIPSVTMFFICAPHVQAPWNPGNVVFLLLLLFSGAVIEWAVYLFISSFGFWFVRTNALRGIAGTFLFRAANYPLHIYGRAFPLIMTFIFPFAFMAYYPTHHFFGTQNPLFSPWLPYLTPLAAVISLSLAWAFWSVGIQRYQSSGT